MNILWYAHSCFMLTNDAGVRILTDPFQPSIGYTLEGVETEIVTISHDHFDHNHAHAATNSPFIIRQAGEYIAHNIRITGYESFHDEQEGALRGNNIIFRYEIDGMRVVHFGDIGVMPSDETLEAIGEVDVLLVPVGGIYTIGPQTACDIANATNTKVMVPMHYQTPKLTLDKKILGVDTLLSVAKNCKIHKLNQSECTITADTLGDDRILMLDPSL